MSPFGSPACAPCRGITGPHGDSLSHFPGRSALFDRCVTLHRPSAGLCCSTDSALQSSATGNTLCGVGPGALASKGAPRGRSPEPAPRHSCALASPTSDRQQTAPFSFYAPLLRTGASQCTCSLPNALPGHNFGMFSSELCFSLLVRPLKE